MKYVRSRMEAESELLTGDHLNTNPLIDGNCDKTLENCMAVIKFLQLAKFNERLPSDAEFGQYLIFDALHGALKFETRGRGEYQQALEPRTRELMAEAGGAS